jgi:hypothetical protein
MKMIFTTAFFADVSSVWFSRSTVVALYNCSCMLLLQAIMVTKLACQLHAHGAS